MIRDAGGLPTSRVTRLSVFHLRFSNEQVVHGFPSDYKLKEGDIFPLIVE